VIVVWEKFSDAEAAVVQEAGAAATLYRLISGSGAEAVTTRAAISNYLNSAIEQDWPQMEFGQESADATRALDTLYAKTERLTATGSGRSAVFYDMFRQLDAITEARRTRLHLATGIVPGIL
jgi:hypothetical protein